MARRLAGRFEARPMAAINLTPMVPVLLALVAVMAVVAARPGKAVDLYVEPGMVPPPADVAALLPPQVMVSLQHDAVFVGQDRVSSLDDAVARSSALAKARGTRVVTIRADADVPYAHVVAVVRLLNKTGLSAQFLNEDLH
jgi:biopolymer transport protein ExbD